VNVSKNDVEKLVVSLEMNVAMQETQSFTAAQRGGRIIVLPKNETRRSEF
jgi:hypothetical protein